MRKSARDRIHLTVILLAAFCLPYAMFSAMEKTDAPAPLPEAREISYTLREFNGSLAVFREDGREPFELYDVPVDHLPESDRIQLREGITASGDEELRRLLEDFTS